MLECVLRTALYTLHVDLPAGVVGCASLVGACRARFLSELPIAFTAVCGRGHHAYLLLPIANVRRHLDSR